MLPALKTDFFYQKIHNFNVYITLFKADIFYQNKLFTFCFGISFILLK